LQAEINAVEEQARLSERVADLTDTQFKQIHDQLDSIRKVNEEMSAVNKTMLMQIDRNHHNIVALQSLKQELDDFKEATCPVLRSARIDEVTRVKLSYACSLH
jgi:hypothetical protein